MPKFREIGAHSSHHYQNPLPPGPCKLIASRYVVQQSLGRGSFGSVFLIKDTKAALGEELKVLKEIPLGDLKPDETVKATQEAQLLSQLHHPAILKFYTSFLERDVFCIITEYCEDRDLDCRLEELRSEGKTLSELQVTQWLVQLLLGVNYMHQRRILHRDLKAKNVFLKRNNVKIGDFGVSCLLIGSCDLATTFTGTPYYMSPEALSHRGYDSKSDIWSLGCILYEMCCLKHAFEGHNFLSMVLKIVEGSTPSLPERYSQELNALLQRMLQKNPSCRISAADALSSTFLEELTQTVQQQFSDLMLMDRTEGKESDVSQIARALQRKVHLQTLRERSEVEKMSPRERMRLRKLQAADDRARKLKMIVEEKYQENHHRMMELRSRHFQKISVNVLKEKPEEADFQMQPTTDQNFTSSLCGPMGEQLADRLNMSEKTERDIPDDPQAAEAYYCEDGFESCSDEDDSSAAPSSSARFCQTFGQDSDIEAMVRHMENVLDEKYSIGEAESSDPQSGLQSMPSINTAMAESKMQHIRQSVCQRLGAELFQRVYDYLKEARLRRDSEESVISALGRLVERPADCFEVDQLLYYEEQLQAAQATLTTLTPT
ncbi:serine/threonine-protein kinase Nek11 isoform X1 [Pygocentrus nattereri]|uniref:non-specific serine/threonine protein kinase n=2 Tax=Pygocentrus nattereri TaxID=42514 RepID=A0A3B4CXH5_PYGNA|nr:serine/threonine-protein kinase Nek11 isoform X1 [Pygocentrus nattereri]